MKAKHLFCIICLLLLHAVSSFGYVLDLKADFDEKVQVAPIQTGAAYYLMKEGHFVLDISEDYAVWLKDYTKEERSDGEISITLTVTLSEPAAFQVSKTLLERIVRFSYHPEKPETMTTDESATKFIRKKLVHSSRIMEAEATIGGKAVCEAVLEMLSKL
jgi:hypothetical protein